MRPVVHAASTVLHGDPPDLVPYRRRLLAEGDSWFTIGTLNLAAASNLLFKLDFSASDVIVNCAYPGDTLQHIAQCLRDPDFDRLLRAPNFASYWEAILLSAGGNDLIDAAQVPPKRRDGTPIPADQRLLLTADEAPGNASRVSEAGWQRLASYLNANVAELARRRDEGPSRGRPLILHTYLAPVPRPAGTVGARRGWLHPAFERYAVPAAMRQSLSDELFGRLRSLLLALDARSAAPTALPHVHVFDSALLTTVVPAAPGSTGISGDWVNEIHLTPEGYGKVGRAMGAWIDALLAGYP